MYWRAIHRITTRVSLRPYSSFRLKSPIDPKCSSHPCPAYTYSSLKDSRLMPLKLEKADIAADFDALIACQWASFENPYQPFFRLFCPVLGGPGPAAHAEAMQTSIKNQRDWLDADPTSYWQKVIDTETGEIVGGALWKICPTNPFETADENFEAYWYPEGSQRDFITQTLGQLEAPRAKMGQRPQLCNLTPLCTPSILKTSPSASHPLSHTLQISTFSSRTPPTATEAPAPPS